jgi:hypothetical protein
MSGDGMGARVGYGAPTRGERNFRNQARESAGNGFLIAGSVRLRVEYARKRAKLMIMIASRPVAGVS